MRCRALVKTSGKAAVSMEALTVVMVLVFDDLQHMRSDRPHHCDERHSDEKNQVASPLDLSAITSVP